MEEEKKHLRISNGSLYIKSDTGEYEKIAKIGKVSLSPADDVEILDIQKTNKDTKHSDKADALSYTVIYRQYT